MNIRGNLVKWKRYLWVENYDIQLNLKEKLVVILGVIYMLQVASAYFFWDNYPLRNSLCLLIPFSLMYLGPNRSNRSLNYNTKLFLFVFLIYFILIAVQLSTGFDEQLARFLTFFPAFVLILSPKHILYMIYRYFYKIIIIFALGSSIVSVLGAIGLLQYLPYFELPPHENLHERLHFSYYVYCGFLTLHGYMSDVIIPRACGFFCEPGHFAITLGFVYILERLQRHSPNLFIIICGLLTFSPNFIFMVFMVELVNVVVDKKYKFLFRTLFLVVITVSLLYFAMPQSIRDSISLLLYERNLMNVQDAFTSSGSLVEALSERTNSVGEIYYSQFIKHGNLLWGETIKDDEIVLSDYRRVLLSQGIVGLLSAIITIIVSLKGVSLKNKLGHSQMSVAEA